MSLLLILISQQSQSKLTQSMSKILLHVVESIKLRHGIYEIYGELNILSYYNLKEKEN